MKINNSVLIEDIQRLSICGLWAKLSGKTLLITGATGMLGSYLALSADMANKTFGYGIKLILMCRNQKKAESLFYKTDCQLWYQDLLEQYSLNEPIHYVIHIASPVGPVFFQNEPISVLSVNTTGTLRLLENVVKQECEGFLLASSHEVYGIVSGEQTEDMVTGGIDPLDTRASYIIGKQAAENALACFHKQFGLRVFSARLSRLYGPLMNMESGLFICDFFRDAINKQPIHVRGELNKLRPLCYIADAAEAMMYILVNSSPGEAYNVQGNELPTIGTIAHMIANVYGCIENCDYPDTEYLTPVGYRLNTDKLQGLGWKQKTLLEDGIKRTINYLH